MKLQVWRSHEAASMEIIVVSVETTWNSKFGDHIKLCGDNIKELLWISHETEWAEITWGSKCGDLIRQQVWRLHETAGSAAGS